MSRSLSDSSAIRRSWDFSDRDAAGLGPPAAELAEDIADRDRTHLRTRHARDLEHRHSGAARLDFDLDLLVVELAGAQLAAERLFGGRAGALTHQRIDHAVLGGGFGARLDVLAFAFTGLGDRDLDQIAYDLLDVTADIADFGELGGFDLEEGRTRELGEAARNLGLADTGRADHEDVLRQHLLAQLLVELETPPAVA